MQMECKRFIDDDSCSMVLGELWVSVSLSFVKGIFCELNCQSTLVLKTIATMTSQTQNFLIFWLLILDSISFQIIFLKNGGHRPLKGRYDAICNDVIFH